MRWADRPAASNRQKVALPQPATHLWFVTEAEISLTENAAKRVAAIAARKHAPAILRLAVDGGGCAGFTYSFDLAAAAEAED